MRKILILGASNNPDRYAFKAANRLLRSGYPIILIGNKKGEIKGNIIQKADQIFTDIHTVTLYLGAQNQKKYYDYIVKTKPKRLIFNPGTENYELELLAKNNHIQVEIACTLVLLSTDQF